MALTEKTGQVQVTFGSFCCGEKCYVRFKPDELDDTYTVTLYKDARYMKPFKEKTFKISEVCGLDWGTFEQHTRFLKYFYKPAKLCTYVTIITKTKSISFVFTGDEGEQLKEWKNAIQKFLYKDRTYVREKLRHEGEDVMLQVGNLNIALTKGRQEDQPAYAKHCWPKEMFYDCQLYGRIMKIIIKTPHAPFVTEVPLECLRGACEDTKILSQEETVEKIKTTLFEFVVCYWFTKEKIYEDLHDAIYTDIESDFYDLNQLEVFIHGGSEEVRLNMHNLYKKVMDSENQYTKPNSPSRSFSVSYDKNDQFILNAGFAIQQIKANPPRPDTLCLSDAIRANICYRLYKETQIDRTGDWTALASEIGIKQGAVDIIKGIVSNELPVNPAGEIILRHWQYTHNKYWHKPESECTQYRPKHPCTKDGLKQALRNIGRNDLVRMVEEGHENNETEEATDETDKS